MKMINIFSIITDLTNLEEKILLKQKTLSKDRVSKKAGKACGRKVHTI